MEQNFNLGELIKSSRKEKEINQGDFAKMIGITQAYLSQIERNLKTISSKNLYKIAEILDIPYPLILLMSIDTEYLNEPFKTRWISISPSINALVKSVFMP